jgi:hypothetical protein
MTLITVSYAAGADNGAADLGSIEDFKAAGKAHGREIFADIANFTDAQTTVQINDVVA